MLTYRYPVLDPKVLSLIIEYFSFQVESQWLLHGIRYKPKLWYYDLMSFVGDPFNTSHADDIDVSYLYE